MISWHYLLVDIGISATLGAGVTLYLYLTSPENEENDEDD